MKKLLSILALLSIAIASGRAAAAPEPHANGDVVADNVGVTLSFSAKGTPTDAKGTVSYAYIAEQQFTGTVSCYSQTDNSAGMSGIIDTGIWTGFYFFVEVIDNGHGQSGEADAFRVLLLFAPYDCTQRTYFYPAVVSTGNINVH